MNRRLLLITLLWLFGFSSLLHAKWVQVNGPFGGKVHTFSVVKDTIYCGTDSSGIFVSTNGGISWNSINNGLSNMCVTAIVLDGINIFAGTAGGGVFLSTDHGSTWNAKNVGLFNKNIVAMTKSGDNFLVGTSNGIFISKNSGSSWTWLNESPFCSDSNSILWCPVSAFAESGQNVYAIFNSHVIFSATNGTSWTSVSDTSQEIYNVLATASSTIFAGAYGGVYFSSNTGASWTLLSAGFPTTGVNALAIKSDSLFAATDSGVFFSPDNGSNWVSRNAGLSNSKITALTICGASIIAGTERGVFISPNGGISWTVSNDGMQGLTINALKENSGTLYAQTRHDIFLSTDGGASWTTITNSLADLNINTFTAENNNLYAGTYSGVFLSTNTGVTWSAANNGLTDQYIYTLFSGNNKVLAGTARGVFLSSNNASSWAPIISDWQPTSVITGLSMSDTNIVVKTMSYRSVSISWCASHGGIGCYFPGKIFLSTNNGLSWVFLDTLDANEFAIHGNYLYVAGSDGLHVYKNQNNAWSCIDSAFPQTTISALLLKDDNLFAGTDSGKVFLLPEGKPSWTAINDGLPNIPITSFSMSGKYFYAGTGGASVWRRLLSEIGVGIDKLPAVKAHNSRICIDYRNILSYYLPEDEDVSIKLFDLKGRLLFSMLHKNEPAGNHSVSLYGKGIFTGINILYFSAGDLKKNVKITFNKKS
jgi:BNR/Asp-box repeat.